jgi:hypothetical protein
MKVRNLLLVVGLLIGASAVAAEGNAQAASAQQQAEVTERVRENDGKGETARAEEKNRVRAGEVGSQQAQDVQARNQTRKMEQSQNRVHEPNGQGAGQKGKQAKKGNGGNKDKMDKKGKKAKKGGNQR